MRFLVGAIFLALLGACNGTPSKGEPRSAAPEGVPEGVNEKTTTGTPSKGQQVTCPVCGLEFGVEEATGSREHHGTTYFFLLEDHEKAFARNPGDYLKEK